MQDNEIKPLTDTADRLLNLMGRMQQLGVGQSVSEAMLVSPAQMALLGWIAGSKGCSVQEIADGLGLTPPTVSVGVRRLEEAGLLKRKSNPHDKRAVQCFLTAKGRAVQDQSLAFRRRRLEVILTGLNPDEQEALIGLLSKAIEAAENAT